MATAKLNAVTRRVSDRATDQVKDLYTAAARSEAKRIITLSAATESSNSITVTATITEADGTAITDHAPIIFQSFAVTDSAGDLSDGGTGTAVKIVNPATGPNVMWMTTVAGVAQAAVANTNAEVTLFRASANGCFPAELVLNFATV